MKCFPVVCGTIIFPGLRECSVREVCLVILLNLLQGLVECAFTNGYFIDIFTTTVFYMCAGKVNLISVDSRFSV